MDLTRIAPTDRQRIQKYGPGGFTVSGETFRSPVLVFPAESLSWAVKSPESLTTASFEDLFIRAQGLDLCLLGCGKRMVPVPPDVKAALKEHGIIIEAMDTGAACRTFNVLLAEGRAVSAALFPSTDAGS